MKKKSAIKVPFRSLTAQEREIVITTSDADDVLYVYVASPKEYRRLASQGWEPVRGDRHGAWFELPKAWLTGRSRASIEKPRREMSPAQEESLAKAREALEASRHLAETANPEPAGLEPANPQRSNPGREGRRPGRRTALRFRSARSNRRPDPRDRN
jgi:hypothetical protein